MEWLLWGLTALGVLLIGAFTLGWREAALFIQITWNDVSSIVGFWVHPGRHLRPVVQQLRTHRVAVGSTQYARHPTPVPHPHWMWHTQTPFPVWWLIVLGGMIIIGAAIFSGYRGQQGGRHALS